MRYCEVPGCERIHKARGYCKKHYAQQYNRYYRKRFPERVKGWKQKASDLTPEQRERINKARRDWRWMLPTDKQEKLKAEARARARKRYKRLKEEGLCSLCAKRPMANGHIRCESCHEKHLESSRRRRAQKDGTIRMEEAWWI